MWLDRTLLALAGTCIVHAATMLRDNTTQYEAMQVGGEVRCDGEGSGANCRTMPSMERGNEVHGDEPRGSNVLYRQLREGVWSEHEQEKCSCDGGCVLGACMPIQSFEDCQSTLSVLDQAPKLPVKEIKDGRLDRGCVTYIPKENDLAVGWNDGNGDIGSQFCGCYFEMKTHHALSQWKKEKADEPIPLLKDCKKLEEPVTERLMTYQACIGEVEGEFTVCQEKCAPAKQEGLKQEFFQKELDAYEACLDKKINSKDYKGYKPDTKTKLGRGKMKVKLVGLLDKEWQSCDTWKLAAALTEIKSSNPPTYPPPKYKHLSVNEAKQLKKDMKDEVAWPCKTGGGFKNCVVRCQALDASDYLQKYCTDCEPWTGTYAEKK